MPNTKPFIIRLVFFQLSCAVLATGFGIYFGFHMELSKHTHLLYENITISHVDVGNQSINEAISLVENAYLSPFLEQDLSVVVNEQTFKAPVKTFFLDSNLKEVTQMAFNYPEQLSSVEKYKLLTGKSEKTFNIALNFDNKAIDTFVQNIIAQTSSTTQDATISIHSDKTGPQNMKINVTPHTSSILIDKNKLVNEIQLALHNEAPLSIDATAFATIKQPDITVDSLEAIDTLIASSSTTFTPHTGSATNIRLSSEAINNTLLMPGDSFSFNDTIGDTTLEKGYTYAPVISNSRYIQGIGGGVCQVSSTLYNAVLQVGLNSLSRRPHSKPSSYLPLGLDATVSWDSIDYQFENTLDYPLYIESYTENDKLIVNLYSHSSLKDTKYKIKSEVCEVLSPPVQYVSDPSLSSGSTKLVQSGSTGYKVKVTREVYEEDVLKGTEVVSLDTYNPSPIVYKRGK